MEDTSNPTMKIECPHCGQHISVDNSYSGTTADCPTCGGAIPIPSFAPPPLPKSAPDPDPGEVTNSDEAGGGVGDSVKNTLEAFNPTFGYFVSIIVRLVWSMTLGLFFFFPIGLLLFVIEDIFWPESDIGYRTLVNMYKWGSCHWFKGMKFQMETDDYTVRVQKERQTRSEN